MTDAPTPDRPDAGTDASAPSPPAFEDLDRDAIPATIRHAPRLGRMLGTGIGAGALVGLILGFALPNSTGVGRGMVAIIVALGLSLAGGLIAGIIATRADAASARATDEERRLLADEQAGEEAS